MRAPRFLAVSALLAAFLAAAVGPSSAAACCRPQAAALAAACGGCCPQPSVCAPRTVDEAAVGRAFSLQAPAASGPTTPSGLEARRAELLLAAFRPHPAAAPPHLSHIPLLV